MTNTSPKRLAISGIDLDRPTSDLVAEVRSDISKVRGKLTDIAFDNASWRRNLEDIEGLLTCGLIALHWLREEVLKHEEQRETEHAGS